MMPKRISRPFLFFMCLSLPLCISKVTFGAQKVFFSAEIVKAERGTDHIDPELENLVKELSPVLNFTGFSLLKKSEFPLKLNEKESIILPEGRTLEISLENLEDGQARVLAVILEKEKEIFRTVLLMADNGSVMIGGPPHENGVLLLRIKANMK